MFERELGVDVGAACRRWTGVAGGDGSVEEAEGDCGRRRGCVEESADDDEDDECREDVDRAGDVEREDVE